MLPRGQAKEFARKGALFRCKGIVLAWPPNLEQGNPWTLFLLMAATELPSRRLQLSIRLVSCVSSNPWGIGRECG